MSSENVPNTAKFDLSLIIDETTPRLAALVADPDRRIAEPPTLDDADRRQLDAPWHVDADATPSSCIHTLFEQQAARAPDAIAVVQNAQQLTYQELNRCANQLAHTLRALGAGPEMPVGICLEPSPAPLLSLLGVLKAGGTAVTLCMIDCMAPVALNVVDLAIDDEILLLGFVRDLASRLGKPMPLNEGELRQRAPAAQLPYLIERARQVQLLPPEIDVAHMQHMVNVYKANLAGMVQYRPQPYPGRMILLRAHEELHRSGGDHTMGWGEVASGPVVIEVVPGNHYTILNPPQVQLLATQLGLLLAAHGLDSPA
jgi:hypothetical protein